MADAPPPSDVTSAGSEVLLAGGAEPKKNQLHLVSLLIFKMAHRRRGRRQVKLKQRDGSKINTTNCQAVDFLLQFFFCLIHSTVRKTHTHMWWCGCARLRRRRSLFSFRFEASINAVEHGEERRKIESLGKQFCGVRTSLGWRRI